MTTTNPEPYVTCPQIVFVVVCVLVYAVVFVAFIRSVG